MISLLAAVLTIPQNAILVPPYVQLGGDPRSIEITWHTTTPSSIVPTYRTPGQSWQSASAPRGTRVSLGNAGVHYVQRASIPVRTAGQRVEYRVGPYSGTFTTPKANNQAFSFIAIGDIGRGTPGQRRLAPQMLAQSADFAMLLGDIAYPNGRVSDYRKYFFPIQNADSSSPSKGAPFLRNILSVGVTGNHDTAYRNLGKYPDGLAYYAYWSNPINGPSLPLKIKGTSTAIATLNEAARGNLDRMANFSFSYGNSRWVVLDANSYVNWRDPKLRQWLANELERSRSATWSFVAMHAPAYHSSKKHASDTQMRSIADLFTKYKVDIVFAGHIHNYQRSKPIASGPGQMRIDERLDGKTHTRADGTIHIVSGAGGAELYDPKQTDNSASWQPYTAAFKTVYSFTKVIVDGRRLDLRQIDSSGKVIDQIRLTK